MVISPFPGQLIVASLLSRNIKSRLLLRDPEKATTLFGKQDEGKLQVVNCICLSISHWFFYLVMIFLTLIFISL